VSDITQMPKLLHGEEREVFGDQAYWSEAHRQAALAKGIRSARLFTAFALANLYLLRRRLQPSQGTCA
jgi:hypothetical protein